jgi:WD40 repeat protein
LILEHGVEVDHVSFSPNGDQILTGSSDGLVRLWPLAGGDPLVFTADLRIEGAGFSPDGKRIFASTEQGGPIWIWPADGTDEPVVIELEGTRLIGGDFFPDGEHVLSAGSDGLARIWRADGSGPTAAFPSGRDDWVYAGISPDGKRVIVKGDGGARVYTTDGSMEPLVLEHAGAVSWSTGFNGELATTSSRDGTVKIWHLDRPNEPITLRHPIDRIERSVGDTPAPIPWYVPAGALTKISRDGTRVFTRSREGTIRVWSTDGIGPEATFSGPGGGGWDSRKPRRRTYHRRLRGQHLADLVAAGPGRGSHRAAPRRRRPRRGVQSGRPSDRDGGSGRSRPDLVSGWSRRTDRADRSRRRRNERAIQP